MSDPVVKVSGLRYGVGRRRIFDGLDLTVARGKVTAVMGPSGTGKTTLLRMIGGLIAPSQGDVRMSGQSILSGGNAAEAR